MSAFDYPRLMLTGKATCSPATGNNCKFAPLSIFDPVSGTNVLPPRLFLDGQRKIKAIFKECRKKGFIVKEETVDGEKHIYIEIAPNVLNDHQTFKDWALLPLGKSGVDTDYHNLYNLIELKYARPGTPISGKVPGYFNFYGTTEFDFSNVKVHSIALHATETGEKILKVDEDPDLNKLFQLELKINDGLVSKPKMVDSASSVSMATQIFWDKLTLHKSSEVLFSGKPCKASLRFANAGRIPVLQGTGGAHCGSGSFFSTIQIEDIEEGRDSEVIKLLFEKYKIKKDEELIGLQIVFNLFEVKEQVNWVPVVDKTRPPVETTVMFAVTPWYKGDLKSISMGRQLSAGMKYLEKCGQPNGDPRVKDYFATPVIAHVDYEQQYLMIDLINNIPEDCSNSFPIPWDDSEYQTMDIGVLECRLYDSQRVLGKIPLNRAGFNRDRYLETSGKIILHEDIKIDPIEFRDAFRNERIALYLYGFDGKNLIDEKDAKDDYVMLESEYMIATDQGSLYGSRHDDPTHGYRCYSGQKEHCKVNIYKRGFEWNEPVSITVLKTEVKTWNLHIDVTNHRMLHYKNGDNVSFPTEKEFNGLYLLYANIDAPIVEELKRLNGPWFWYAVNAYFNSYVGVRILPHQDYNKYLNLRKRTSGQVTFEILKKEVFDRYDLLYPFMSRLFPFDEQLFRKNQDHIYELMNFDNWENSTYMPVSRDLSPQQLRLFLEWMEVDKGAYHHSADLTVVSTTPKEGFVPR